MKVWIILSLLVFAIIVSQGQAANVALNKPARQSSELNHGLYPASKAVNGRKTVVDDFSHTGADGTVRWWKVDLEGDYLIKNVIIYNRLDCCDGKLRLREFYVLTSNTSNPGDPSPISDKWIIRHYQHDEVGFKATNSMVNFTLYTKDTVRQVAVYTMNTEPLNLAEVEVYNYSHSEDAPVNQIVSGTAAKFNGTVKLPEAAVDGNTNMFSAPFTTVNSQSSWVVKLKQLCGSFCYIRVFPRLVKNQFNNAGFTKLSRLQTLTYHEETLPDQNAGAWTDECDVYEFPQKGPLLQICKASAIWFIRLVNFGQGQIQFTEVQVFSRAPSPITSLAVEGSSSSCVSVSWSAPRIPNGVITSYKINCTNKTELNESGKSQQVCGYNPYQNVTCTVRAINGYSGGELTTATGFTLCDSQAGNIALNKPARQSSKHSGSYLASNAVNGIKNDFSHTGTDGTVRWWKVDLECDYLIKNVIIYNRLDCCDGRLRQFYVLTSNIIDPDDPSPISDKWNIRHYQHDGVGFRATNSTVNFNLYTTDAVRQVAVYTINTEALNLAEVEVYDYSHSEDAPVNQIDSGTAAKFNGTVTSP